MASVTFKGLEKVTRNLNRLAEKAGKKGSADALRKAARPMLRRAKANARAFQRTGTLRRSLTIKTRRDRRGGGITVIVAPNKNIRITIRGKTHIPANIAHLLEFGFRHRGGVRVPGKHFLERAFDSTAQQAIEIYTREIRESTMRAARQIGGNS